MVKAVLGKRLLIAILVGVLIVTVAAPIRRVQAQGEGGFTIYSIQVLGNENVTSDYILGLLTVHAGDIVSSNAVTLIEKNADILEKTGFFRERPMISYESYADGAMLVIEVKEWPLFKELRFTGNSIFTSEQLLAALNDFVAGRGEEVKKQKGKEKRTQRTRSRRMQTRTAQPWKRKPLPKSIFLKYRHLTA